MYIWIGSLASASGVPCATASEAKNEPMSCFAAPSTTQPGPAHITAIHHRALLCSALSGMKRR